MKSQASAFVQLPIALGESSRAKRPCVTCTVFSKIVSSARVASFFITEDCSISTLAKRRDAEAPSNTPSVCRQEG